MAGLSPSHPRGLVVRAYWQNMSADDDYRPNDWRRPEFNEADRPRAAREGITHWLQNEPELIRLVRDLRESAEAAGGDRTAAGEVVAAWLDDALYGTGKSRFPSKDMRISIQLVADSWARADVCRMDWGLLMDDVCGVDL